MPTTQVSFAAQERTLQRIQAAGASGEFATPEAFLGEVIDSYESEREAREHFLATEAVAIADRIDADPSRRRTPEQVLERLGMKGEKPAAA